MPFENHFLIAIMKYNVEEKSIGGQYLYARRFFDKNTLFLQSIHKG